MERENAEKNKFDMESFRILAELSNAIILEWDVKNDYLHVADNWELVFGKKPTGELFSKNIKRNFIIASDCHDVLTQYINKIQSQSKPLVHRYEKFELKLRTLQGEYRWFQLRMLLRCNKEDKAERVFGLMTDINTQKNEYEKLLQQAQKDVLTGLFNKGTTENFITEYLLNDSLVSKKQALFIIDIDGFKAINDNLGHLFGDAVIAELAKTIQSSFRNSDIVGRFGGDEFVALLKNINTEEIIQEKAWELVENLRREYKADKEKYQVSASIGIAVCPDSGNTFAELFEKADKAMYHVKSAGKNNYYIYHDAMPTYEYVSERMDYELPSGDKKNKKAFTENIIEYIFRILYRSKDANAATNLILEVIGRKYNISRAFILEKITEKKFSTTFEWCNDGIISRQNIEQNIPREVAMRFYKHFDEEGIFSYADIAILPNDLKGFFSDSPVKAILECAIYDDKGDFYGGICFEYHQHPRCWTDEEIESLSFTAEILGTFLQQKRYMDSMNLSRVQALEILDHIDAFIYVIDKKTYEILFFNKKAAEFFGTDSLGKNCFNIICDEETKCSFCPIDLMAEALQSIKKDIYIAKRKIWLRIAVSKIYWQQNREVCLVHAHDITTMKNKQNKK